MLPFLYGVNKRKAMRILIVDDNEDSRVILKKTLEYDRHTVEAACNGEEALNKAGLSLPDMIISDILMPGMDGFRLCHELKQHEKLQKIPLILYTATYVDPKDKKLAMSLGASRFILKPIETDEFLKIIHNVFQEYNEEKLPVPENPDEEKHELSRMYEESVVRKLDEKIQELKLYRQIFESSKDAIAIINTKGFYIEQNPAHEQLIGYSIKDLNGKTPVVHFGDGVFHEILKDLSDKGVYRGELTSRTKSGTELDIELSAFPIFSSKNKVLGYVCIQRDITERRQAEAEKQKLHDQLIQAQKLESIGRLAGGIAHDFNNMLTSILGYSELSLMALPEDSHVRGHINIIHDAGLKAEMLIRQLLAFSRKQVLEVKVINLNAIVENLGKMLRRMIGEDVLLELNVELPVRNVMADQVQVEQILMNLAVNAKDAMPCGGRLIIETTDVVLDEEYAHFHEGVKAGSYVMLSVTDTGTGISKEVLQKLFEPFFTTKEVGKGTGLGLSTVYGIVKQHKGHIYVDSKEGKGTTFKVYLPVTGENEEDVVSGDKMIMSYGTETILVVDDEPSIRGLISDSLQPLGYKVIEAACGEEALQICKQEKAIDLLLADVIMPGISGKELADKFKAIRPGIKIVFMSGYSGEEISNHKITAEDVVFIQKPLMPTSLAKRLREILGGG